MSRSPRRERKKLHGLKLGSTPPADVPLYPDEEENARASVLGSLGQLDSAPEERFDRICRLAQDVMQAPATYISLLDRERQWFKSTCGMGDVTETPREGTFCDYAVRRSSPTVVLDATADPLFALSPYVTEGPQVRFYAGFPLIVKGERVGTLCALDFQAREEVSDRQLEQLYDLARMAEQELGAAPEVEAASCDRAVVTVLQAGLPSQAELFDSLEPELVFSVLNLYLQPLVALVEHWKGALVETSSETLRAVFEPFEGEENHSVRAANCALEMRQALVPLSIALEERGMPFSLASIGLHSGEVARGRLGAAEKTTVVGSTVGLAAKLQSLAIPGQILMSQETLDSAGDRLSVSGGLSLAIPGQPAGVTIFEVLEVLPQPGGQV